MAASAWWNSLSLDELNDEQWEALCDGCGKCCLHKLQDEDTNELVFTNIACKLLDTEQCRCKQYDQRLELVSDCLDIRQHDLDELIYMPSTCAYRLRYEGRPLESWHPLVSGRTNSVHRAKMSVRGKVISEQQVPESDWDLYIIDNL